MNPNKTNTEYPKSSFTEPHWYRKELTEVLQFGLMKSLLMTKKKSILFWNSQVIQTKYATFCMISLPNIAQSFKEILSTVILLTNKQPWHFNPGAFEDGTK